MTYNQRLKATQDTRQAVEGLQKEGDRLRVRYKGTSYVIKCYSNNDKYGSYLSIRKDKGLFSDSMNIDSDKSTKEYLYLYSYDMMGSRTIYKMRFIDMKREEE